MAPILKTLVGVAGITSVAGISIHAEKWSGCGPVPGHKRKHQSALLAKKVNTTGEGKNPGDGIDQENMAPFEESYKDGFAATECVLDQLLQSGDKYGDGKFSYKLGDSHDVSIVNYDDLVAKEDREPITQKVCFEFCRTIKNMNFFGLTNGRGCYCAPFFKQQAGDSSACDAPCDGNTEQMCGGKTKSSIFEMHSCGDAIENLVGARKKLTDMLSGFSKTAEEVGDASAKMQGAAQTLQDAFGKVGDTAASGLCQEAKAFAGKMEHPAEDGVKQAEESKALTEESDPDGDRAMEQLTEKLAKSLGKVEELNKELTGLHAQGIAPADVQGNPGELYKSVMYFVDKEFRDEPSTCGGKLAADPLVGSYDGCAVACETTMGTAGVGGCVGFQYMPSGDTGLCFLFSELKTTTYYTGCKASFLQQKKAAADTKCMVKFSEFQGTTLAPNPSGKCPACLKEATKADRCFE